MLTNEPNNGTVQRRLNKYNLFGRDWEGTKLHQDFWDNVLWINENNQTLYLLSITEVER